jgi:hypothetical protein
VMVKRVQAWPDNIGEISLLARRLPKQVTHDRSMATPVIDDGSVLVQVLIN